MSHLQPLTLHSHPGPNPWKVAILLEEVKVPYTSKVYMTPELKLPSFLALNRNGLAPVIEDPNTHILLSEVISQNSTDLQRLTAKSGAIMDYVVEQYDTDNHISFTTLKEKYLMKQWLQFQTTTQGPILQHILRWARESNPAARAGYINNFRRVLQVLEDELADKEWLVGGKCSAADLSHVPFHYRLDFIMGADMPDMEKEFPQVHTWQMRMMERPTVQRVLADQQEAWERISAPQAES